MRYLKVLALVAAIFASFATVYSALNAPAPIPPVVSITVNGTMNAPISVLVAPR